MQRKFSATKLLKKAHCHYKYDKLVIKIKSNDINCTCSTAFLVKPKLSQLVNLHFTRLSIALDCSRFMSHEDIMAAKIN